MQEKEWYFGRKFAKKNTSTGLNNYTNRIL